MKKIFFNKYFIFIFSFLLMFFYLMPLPDLFYGSGDAHETWGVIKTFFSSDKYTSYVMYKGLYAFVPGVICYQLSNILNISFVLIMKVFHSLGFAYIASVGIPYIIRYLFKYDIKVWQKYLFIVMLFILENSLFVFISVDFMSLALLVMCINSLIKITNNLNINKAYYLYSGFIIGICTCLSGQFLLSALILAIYFVYLIVKRFDRKKIVLILVLFFTGFIFATGLNKVYVKTVVEPARNNGAWIPDGSFWLKFNFTSSMLITNYPMELKDNLGGTIILNEKLNVNDISSGAVLYDTPDMIKMVLRYPVIFFVRWSERFLLGILNDRYNSYPIGTIFKPIMQTFIMVTLLFVSLLLAKRNTKKVKDLLSFKNIIILCFIFSALVPCVFHVENRYFFGFRTFIIAIFCLSDFLPNLIKKLENDIKNFKFKNLVNYKINHTFVEYIIFVIVVCMLYIAIYQSAGANISMTYEIF